jgi:hypothetical protein
MPMDGDEAQALLLQLGAAIHLVRHGQLVAEAGDLLLAAVRRLGVEVDEDFVRADCLLHDVGKAFNPEELHGDGAEHEAAGERLLVAHGVDARTARCCRSHAQWRSMADVSLEELLVALADVTWKGRRSPELEGRVVDEVARRTGRDWWTLLVAIDDAVERVADGGLERLVRS